MTSALVDRAEAVRRFNRSYTRRLGVLNEHLMNTKFSLTESRILYELGIGTGITSADLRQALGLDAGYLSRTIAGLEKNGLVTKTRSTTDARASHLSLTERGTTELASLEEAARDQVIAALEQMPEAQQKELVQAMRQVQSLLGEDSRSYLLRDPGPGDMGAVVQQQAELYAREYGFNGEFEALLAEIVAQYLRGFDPTSERCWIAEKNGKVVGSVFVVRQDQSTAKLRMLYVDASARGMGIGRRLIDASIQFARSKGYSSMELWTTSVLVDAARLYQKAGFRLIEEEKVHSFGQDLVSQTWALEL